MVGGKSRKTGGVSKKLIMRLIKEKGRKEKRDYSKPTKSKKKTGKNRGLKIDL